MLFKSTTCDFFYLDLFFVFNQLGVTNYKGNITINKFKMANVVNLQFMAKTTEKDLYKENFR